MVLVIAVYVLLPLALLSVAFLLTTSSVLMKISYAVGLLTASFIFFRIGYWEVLGLAVRKAFVLLAVAAAALPFFHFSGTDSRGKLSYNRRR